MEVMVSILTTAYNHAPYIAQALDSFVMQKTNFKYEVIVHDDASTDGTADIIREYAEKYPDIIRPVFQTENKYSQGINVYDLMTPLVRGKYVAQCEGDDYWCDDNKLQKQVDYMEAHPECSYCFCNSYRVDVNSNIIGEQTPVQESRVFSSREIIRAPRIFLATAGTMYRAKDVQDFSNEFVADNAGDVMLRNFLMLRGNAYGFAENMACYRVMTPGSYSEQFQNNSRKNPEKLIQHLENYIRTYENFDRYSNGECHDDIQGEINSMRYSIYLAKSDWKALRSPLFREKFARNSFRTKTIIFVKYYFPGVVKIFRYLKYGKAGLEKKY